MLLSCLSVCLHQFLQLNHHHVHNQFGNQEFLKKNTKEKTKNCACKQVNRKAHFATTSLSIDLTHIDLLLY